MNCCGKSNKWINKDAVEEEKRRLRLSLNFVEKVWRRDSEIKNQKKN